MWDLWSLGYGAWVTGLTAGVPSGWGIAAHDVTADVVWVNDGVGSTVYPPATTTTSTVHDGCNYTAGAGGVPRRFSRMNRPRFTGDVRVGFDVTTSTEPCVSSPPRGLSAGRVTRRISFPVTSAIP